MLKFVAKALKSLVLDEYPRDKLKQARRKKKAAAPAVQAERPRPEIPRERPPGTPPPEEFDLALRTKKKMTPKRRKLIAKALEMQRSKAEILKDLSIEDREKLHLMANAMFLGKGGAKKKK